MVRSDELYLWLPFPLFDLSCKTRLAETFLRSALIPFFMTLGLFVHHDSMISREEVTRDSQTETYHAASSEEAAWFLNDSTW